jgi:plasmid maintenance system antidote protein VapI
MKRQTGSRIPIFGGLQNRRKYKDAPSVGNIIKDILKEQSITIGNICKKADVKIYVLSKVINDVRKLDEENARKLEIALELSPNYLMSVDKKYRARASRRTREESIEEDEYDDEPKTVSSKSNRQIEEEYRNFHRTMKDHIYNLMIGNLRYILISINETYAVIAKVVNLNIRKYTETMFQSVDREIKQDFCILTIFEWGRGLPDDSPLNHLGCAITKLYTTEEVEKRLQEIGSV